MKKQILSEEFKRMQFLAGIITEGEMWDRDASHRDTYGDYNDERSYEEEEEDYADAEIVKNRVSPDFPIYTALIDDRGNEYANFLIFDTKAELEKAMKDQTYGPKAGYYNLPDGRVAVAFPARSSKGEDFGGM
jgi:hypothetical protein